MGRAATNADEPAVHRAVGTVNSLGLAIALRGTLGYLLARPTHRWRLAPSAGRLARRSAIGSEPDSANLGHYFTASPTIAVVSLKTAITRLSVPLTQAKSIKVARPSYAPFSPGQSLNVTSTV